MEVCTNYRLARRREEAARGDKGDRKGDETMLGDGQDNKRKPQRTNKKAPSGAKGKGKGRGDRTMDESLRSPEEEAAAAKRREEIERKAREE